MKSLITINRSNPFYTTSLNNFRKQFKDVVRMTKVYVNLEKKVFAGEWIDGNGVINFNSGYAPEVYKTVEFVD